MSSATSDFQKLVAQSGDCNLPSNAMEPAELVHDCVSAVLGPAGYVGECDGGICLEWRAGEIAVTIWDNFIFGRADEHRFLDLWLEDKSLAPGASVTFGWFAEPPEDSWVRISTWPEALPHIIDFISKK
jgi:hypothetical protein